MGTQPGKSVTLLDPLKRFVELGFEREQLGVLGKQLPPVASDVLHPEALGDEVAAAASDRPRRVVVLAREPDEVFGVGEVAAHRHVVDPGLEGRVEELEPLVVDVVDERVAEEEVLEAEAGGHAPEVE